MQLNREQAIKMSKDKMFKRWTDREIFLFQISQEKLCCDFSVFHKATESVLKRSVLTDEFSAPEYLLGEFLSMEEGK